MSSMEEIGTGLVKNLYGEIEKQVTEYCNAVVDDLRDYCIQKFKGACETAGIAWDSKWEDILNG